MKVEGTTIMNDIVFRIADGLTRKGLIAPRQVGGVNLYAQISCACLCMKNSWLPSIQHKSKNIYQACCPGSPFAFRTHLWRRCKNASINLLWK